MNSLAFSNPITISVSGTTGAGKTTWVYRLLREKEFVFEKNPEKVLYCYGIWQDLYSEMEKNLTNLVFHEGLPTIETIKSMPAYSLIVLDDLAHVLYSKKDMDTVFSQVSHHCKISLIHIKNNIFYQGKNAKTISINTHIHILMQNPTDEFQILTMGRQMLPKNPRSLLDAYNESMDLTGYLVVDLRPHTDKRYRLRTRIFSGEYPIIFIPV
jgi:hypothetical protein